MNKRFLLIALLGLATVNGKGGGGSGGDGPDKVVVAPEAVKDGEPVVGKGAAGGGAATTGDDATTKEKAKGDELNWWQHGSVIVLTLILSWWLLKDPSMEHDEGGDKDHDYKSILPDQENNSTSAKTTDDFGGKE